MRLNGEACSLVTRSFYQGDDANGNTYWNIACADGRNWAIQIAPDKNGSSRIIACDTLAAVNATPCFTKF